MADLDEAAAEEAGRDDDRPRCPLRDLPHPDLRAAKQPRKGNARAGLEVPAAPVCRSQPDVLSWQALHGSRLADGRERHRKIVPAQASLVKRARTVGERLELAAAGLAR
jgi:hypothetical protein